MIVCLTPPQMNDFGDLLGTPNPPVSKIAHVKDFSVILNVDISKVISRSILTRTSMLITGKPGKYQKLRLSSSIAGAKKLA